MGRIALIREFWEFLRYRKKYWLLPLIAILVALGLVIVFAEGSAAAPFIYSLF